MVEINVFMMVKTWYNFIHVHRDEIDSRAINEALSPILKDILSRHDIIFELKNDSYYLIFKSENHKLLFELSYG